MVHLRPYPADVFLVALFKDDDIAAVRDAVCSGGDSSQAGTDDGDAGTVELCGWLRREGRKEPDDYPFEELVEEEDWIEVCHDYLAAEVDQDAETGTTSVVYMSES